MLQKFFVLEQLRSQKLGRERRRRQYQVQLKKIQKIKSSQNPSLHEGIPRQSLEIIADSQIGDLEKENKSLRNKLEELQLSKKQKMDKFFQDFDAAKELYAEKIRQIVLEIRKTKSYYVGKLQQVRSQIESADMKSIHISTQTKNLEAEIEERKAKMKSYELEIQKQYGEKLKDFEKIYTKSCEKMTQQVQKQRIKDEELVESTLKSDELLEQIMDSIEQNKDQVEENYKDYSQLLKTKKEIIKQLIDGNERKSKEIENLKTIKQKMSLIFQKLKEEKQIYIEQNNSMAEELIQVKAVLQGALGI